MKIINTVSKKITPLLFITFRHDSKEPIILFNKADSKNY